MFSALALSLCFSPPNAVACERYYVLLFGGQAEVGRARTAHTWATFVQASPNGLEEFTISWLPNALPVHVVRRDAEPGRNYGLHETLADYNHENAVLDLWGPWEIRKDWYCNAAAHKAVLDSGAVQFKVLDRGPLLKRSPLRHPELSHCVHAVVRTDESLRQAAAPILNYGSYITRKVAVAMNEVGLLVETDITHDWLLPALNLTEYPLTNRKLGEPLLKIRR